MGEIICCNDLCKRKFDIQEQLDIGYTTIVVCPSCRTKNYIGNL